MKPKQMNRLTEVQRNRKNQDFELRFYSGYKGEETPRAVRIGEKEFKIQEILRRKRGYDQKSGRRFEDFKCLMEGQRVRITVYDTGEWAISFSD
jgi:hypothetical protein